MEIENKAPPSNIDSKLQKYYDLKEINIDEAENYLLTLVEDETLKDQIHYELGYLYYE